jgi:hypothetical protein
MDDNSPSCIESGTRLTRSHTPGADWVKTIPVARSFPSNPPFFVPFFSATREPPTIAGAAPAQGHWSTSTLVGRVERGGRTTETMTALP